VVNEREMVARLVPDAVDQWAVFRAAPIELARPVRTGGQANWQAMEIRPRLD
jgi:hypothetical protein